MGIRSLKNNTFSRELALGSPAGNAYDCIGVVSLSSTSSSISFTSIPGTYTHLQIRCTARTSSAQIRDSIKVTFNSDTAANYSRHALFYDGSTITPYGNANDNYCLLTDFGAASSGTSVFGTSVVDILDYANTNKYKTTRSIGGIDINGTGTLYNGLSSGSWRSTSIITSITLVPYPNSNFVQYSHFALYGMW